MLLTTTYTLHVSYTYQQGEKGRKKNKNKEEICQLKAFDNTNDNFYNNYNVDIKQKKVFILVN